MTDSGWYERHWRWFVLGTLFFATFLNYLDRQTLSVAMTPIAQEFGLTNIQRGNLLAAFVFSYAFAHLFIGFFLDRICNIRIFFPLIVLGWSLSNMLVGLARSYEDMLWLRYLLGVWESANFPLCLLIIARIFPARERSFAAGIFNSGAVIATLIAPKLVIYLSDAFSWRYSFLATGLFGLLWLPPWLLIFRKVEQRALFWPVRSEKTENRRVEAAESIIDIFRSPGFWGVVLVGIGLLPGWYFMSQWLPSFLTQEWSQPFDQALGNKLTMIYLMQDLGLWIGGGAVWYLAKKGIPILRARKTVIVAAYLMMMSMLLLPVATSVNMVVVVLCVYIFGLAGWQSNQQAFKQDVARTRVATVAALVGFAETGMSAFVVQRVGIMTEAAGGFSAVFLLLAGCFTFALCMLFVLIRPRWMEIR